MEITPIAHIYTDFKEKFGIPRQSGRASAATGRIVFEKQFRNPDMLRGIEDFSHLWLIFDFSASHRETLSPTVRPPRLGGNARVGVFASRSPFRPNFMGLSAVKLEKIEHTETDGDVLIVSGVDLLNGTPVYDIKPYLKYADSLPDATGSYGDANADYRLDVTFLPGICDSIPDDKLAVLKQCLADDPRPSYQEDETRIYSMIFSGFDVHFKVCDKVLTVVGVDFLEDRQ